MSHTSLLLKLPIKAMLIGLMSLPNQVVYVQFHPVAYMVKLNIEMSMASLITRLAKNHDSNPNVNSLTYSQAHRTISDHNHGGHNPGIGLKSFHKASIQAIQSDGESQGVRDDASGIHQRFDVDVRVDHARSDSPNDRQDDDSSGMKTYYRAGDEISLVKYAGHPNKQC